MKATNTKGPAMTPQQNDVLSAAVDLMRGGLDMEESFLCYRTISTYVLKTIPPDEGLVDLRKQTE
jgi:hypothetical protein